MTARLGENGLPVETSHRMDIALAIPQRDGKLLVAQRAAGTHLEGFWEFPGGKIEEGEDPAAAARRELAEETGLRAGRLEPLTLVVHDYSEMPLRFHVFLARDVTGDLKQEPGRQWVWKCYDALCELEMPPANRQMLRALRWRIG